MALPKYTDFSHFARDLFIHTEGRCFKNCLDRFDELDVLPIVDDMRYYCLCFSYTYDLEFLSVFRQAEYDDFETEEQFLRYAIPRCLNIVFPGVYFYSLLLVSAFLKKFLSFLWQTRRCCRFHMVAYKCYVAVFKRAFESSFESHGGMEGLEEYLEELKRNYPRVAIVDNIPNALHLQKVRRLPRARSVIKNCSPLHDDDFVLNEFERSLLVVDRLDEFLNENFNSGHEDPLGFEWPIRREQVLWKLEVDLYEYDFSEGTYLMRYVSALELEAEDMCESDHELKEFEVKMQNRMCPCCGIRCYQFSSALLKKQWAISLKRMPSWKKCLLRFIERCQERITRLIRFALTLRPPIAFYILYIEF